MTSVSVFPYGIIAISGGAGGGVSITNQAPSGVALFPGTATGGAYFQNNGSYYNNSNFSYTAVTGEWYDPLTVGIGGDYDIRAVLVSQSGTATRTGPTLSTWHSLATTRHWYIQTNSLGFKSWVLDISIRDATTLTVLDTARYTMSVEVL